MGREITYNQCLPFEVSKIGKIKVCGAGTVVNSYLRGRCEGNSHYVEEVSHCPAVVDTDSLHGRASSAAGYSGCRRQRGCLSVAGLAPRFQRPAARVEASAPPLF